MTDAEYITELEDIAMRAISLTCEHRSAHGGVGDDTDRRPHRWVKSCWEGFGYFCTNCRQRIPERLYEKWSGGHIIV